MSEIYNKILINKGDLGVCGELLWINLMREGEKLKDLRSLADISAK